MSDLICLLLIYIAIMHIRILLASKCHSRPCRIFIHRHHSQRNVLGAKMDLRAFAAKPMIDVVLAVRDPCAWHARNLSCNPCHYSGAARALGARIVTAVQEGIGGRMYYNTLIPIETGLYQGRYLK